MNGRQKATRNSWKREPFPEHTRLNFNRTFTADEHEQISYGFIPESMDHHWFIYLEEERLYFYRSWTGFCIYEVGLERNGNAYDAAEILVNRNPDQYGGTDDKYDAALVSFLIDKFLLRRETAFPLPSNKPRHRTTNI